MKAVQLNLGGEVITLQVPAQTDVLTIRPVPPLSEPQESIQMALENSIASPNLDEVIRSKLALNDQAKAVVVISDNTRPVPYKGPEGILWPIIDRLLQNGVCAGRILILVATGTHRALTDAELRRMLDPRVFEHKIRIKNHDAWDHKHMECVGTTGRGTQIHANRDYMSSDIKILTGLVESHFMAGFSGGRKSLCPGLVSNETCYVFHGASILSSESARDLVLEGNPCHEEALEVGLAMGADYIVNVTLNRHQVTGVFAGDMVKAHEAAAQAVHSSVGIPLDREYDLVITHAGYAGINHYQAAKAGVAAIPAVHSAGKLLLLADNTDHDPIGSARYRTILHLLKLVGPDKFLNLIHSPSWEFIPDQWEVQMWARLFSKIPFEHFIYYSPQMTKDDYDFILGIDGNRFLASDRAYRGNIGSMAEIVTNALGEEIGGKNVSIAYLADGPYGIPYKSE